MNDMQLSVYYYETYTIFNVQKKKKKNNGIAAGRRLFGISSCWYDLCSGWNNLYSNWS